MKFSHILITRPHAEAKELADMLAPFPAKTIILPAFEFQARPLPAAQVRQLERAAGGARPLLLIFTSPRAVDFGLGQIPPSVVRDAQIAAIGPSTTELLRDCGIRVDLSPRQGYSSEDLLPEIGAERGLWAGSEPAQAFILAAPGGRDALREGLESLGFTPRMLIVYERLPAALEPELISAVERTESLLVVWSSQNAMNDLSRRLPLPCWNRLLRAHWLVISERLASLANAFGPAQVHQAQGPSNTAILQAIQALD